MSYSNYYPTSGMVHGSLPALMGTRMDVLLFDGDAQQLEDVWKWIEQKGRMLEKMLNRFDPVSEVSIVNDNARFSAFILSDELWSIMLDCRRYHEMTEGYFDVTRTNFEKIIFVDESQCIRFGGDGVILDFGGYAKGYALKCIHKRLDEVGIQRALINFGNSSALALGGHPHGDSWLVSIDDSSDVSAFPPIHLYNESLSVSGNSHSRKAHIFNPKTSELVVGEQMVAVVADDPVDAEVLTTAWIASGSQNEPEWFDKFNMKNKYRVK